LVGTKGKGMALLRVCNDLRKKVSNDFEFASAILLFLTKLFPKDEKSAVNLRGDYSSKTTIQIDQDGVENEYTLDSLLRGNIFYLEFNFETPINYSFYKKFWTVQVLSLEPWEIYKGSNWSLTTKVFTFKIDLR